MCRLATRKQSSYRKAKFRQKRYFRMPLSYENSRAAGPPEQATKNDGLPHG
jgi:hypothetical protein